MERCVAGACQPGPALICDDGDLRFVDKTGSVAAGLRRLQVKTGGPGKPDTFTAKGVPSGPTFGGDTSNSVTLIAGPACATTTLPCAPSPNGKTRMCK